MLFLLIKSNVEFWIFLVAVLIIFHHSNLRSVPHKLFNVAYDAHKHQQKNTRALIDDSFRQQIRVSRVNKLIISSGDKGDTKCSAVYPPSTSRTWCCVDLCWLCSKPGQHFRIKAQEKWITNMPPLFSINHRLI